MEHTIEFNGFLYATLDSTAPGDTAHGSQKEFIPLPPFWELAPNDPEILRNVIAKYNWGTLVLTTREGCSYWTANSNSPGSFCEPDGLEHRAKRFKPRRCRILVRKPIDNSIDEDHMLNFGSRMWDKRQFTDCTIACLGHEFACHREVLALASPVFSQMLASGMKEGLTQRIDIGDAEPSVVEAMTKFMYTGSVDFNALGVPKTVELLKLANRYDLTQLAAACGSRLVQQMSTDNAADVVRATRSFSEIKSFAPIWEQICEKVHLETDLYLAVMKML